MFRWLWNALFGNKETIERPSPKIRIRPEQVKIENGTLTVTGLVDCFIAAIAPSNSMESLIDDGMFVLLDRSVPASEIIAGDILWFKSPTFEAIHRVIEIGADEQGWWAKSKGDNNAYADPGVIRKSDVQGVWRATLN